MYATIGVAVAYFTYRRGMQNLQISTVFVPCSATVSTAQWARP
jgi:choline-glycine betaine transporter